MQSRDEVVALTIQAVGKHDREAKALRGQLLDELDGQLWLALVDIAWLEAAAWLVEAEGQRKGHRIKDAVGIDGYDAVGQRVHVADVLAGGVVGGLAFLAIAWFTRSLSSMQRMNGRSRSA